jgi:putative PEP-CTERM system histidine kinase
LDYDGAVLGYALSAAAYAALLGVCLTAWRRRLMGSGLVTALTAQLGWSVLQAAVGAGARVPVGILLAAEYLRDLAWALVLMQCLAESGTGRIPRAGRQLVLSLMVVVGVGAVVSLVPSASGFLARYVQPNRLWGGFVLATGGIVLVEQVARNTRSARLWELKFLWLAIGGMYAWDICLFSTAMLHGGPAPDFWVARGFVNALLAAVMAIGLQRIPQWQAEAFLSRRIVFFNATLLAIALYVLIMAAGSYYVRALGGSWGTAGQLLFLAVGALVLAAAVLSGKLRAWLRVTIAKHFFPYRYDYRSEWRKLTRTLSEESDLPVYERIANVVAGFLSAANGGLWLRDGDGAYCPSGGDLAPPQAPRESQCREFFDHLLRQEWIYDLDGARDGHSRKPAPQPPGWMLADRRLWLVVPLICEGTLVGFVALGHSLAEVDLGWEEIDLLRAAGRQIASFLAVEQAAKRLAEAHQFEAMNRLSAIIMHDLRHLIAQQALVVQNAARHRGNPQFFDDAILTIEESVKRMTRLMDQLRAGSFSEETRRVELNGLCAEAVRRCHASTPVPVLRAAERPLEAVLDRDRLLQALEHIIRNAQEATPADGSVIVSLARAGEQAVLEIADTGSGMDGEFVRHRLFRPFDTTKGDRGFGIGAYQAREFVRRCGGSVEVESAPQAGTRFIIRLPLAPALAPARSDAAHELQAN